MKRILLALVAALAGCTAPEPKPAPAAPEPAQVDKDVLETAFHDCFLADCERAYAHATAIASSSPLRQSDAFRAIQYRYDADRLLRADVELDLDKKREQLKALAQSVVTDSSIRLGASERLARMGAQTLGGTEEVALNARADDRGEAAAESIALDAKSKSKDPADWRDVRAKLEPKIFSGKATASDVTILKTVCTAQNDVACLKLLKGLIVR